MDSMGMHIHCSRKGIRPLILFFLASLPLLSCAQSRELTAEPASIEGKFEDYRVLDQLPLMKDFHPSPQVMPSFRSESELRVLKTASRYLQAAALPQGTTPPPPGTGVPSILTSFDPPNSFDQGSCGGVRFSDGGLAINANYLFEIGTSCVKVLNPTTGAVISGPKSLSSFFGSSSNTSNARALYDPINQRFLASAEDYNSNRFYIAVTQTSNPTGTWNIYSFPMSGTCSSGNGDNPRLGQTSLESGDPEGAIYLAWDIYCPGSGPSNFVGAISKTLAYSGAPIATANGFQGLNVGGVNVDGLQPANVMNSGDQPRGEFVLNSFNLHFGGGSCVSGCNGIAMWDFFNGIPATGSSQSISGVVVPTANTYFLPVNAPQPGCSSGGCGPNTGEPVMGGEVTYSAGSLFGALNDGMGILVVEIEPQINDAGAVTGGYMRNEICFACGGFSNSGQAYDGAVQPDSERNWVMVYNYSAPGTSGCSPNPTTCVYPSAAYITRRVTQTQNSIDNTGGIYALGQAYYAQVNSQGVNRWGDFSAVAPNYTLPNAFWFFAEYSEASGTWGAAVGQSAYSSPTQP